MGFSKKISNTFKVGKSSNFAVECDWNSKISQNVEIFGVFAKKNKWVFEKNFEFCQDR